jgi:hypothetical protein
MSPPRCAPPLIISDGSRPRRDQQQVRTIRLGTRTHSAIEQAVGARISDPDWDERLTEALTDFPGCTWPLEQFTPPPEEGSS